MYLIINTERKIKSLLDNYLKKIGYKENIKLEKPSEKLGDFSFPCYQLAKILRKSPNDIALDISKNIKIPKIIEEIKANGAYVNFFIDKKLLKKSTIDSILKDNEKYGNLQKKNNKVIIEHTSANPNGPLHVGRARNPIIGDTMVRIFKSAGFEVESQFYLDDMGKQVAILAWGIENVEESEIEKTDYDKDDHKTVGFYQIASKKMKNDENINNEISDIVKKLEEGNKGYIDKIHKAYSPVLKGINESLNKINIKIDKYIPESKFLENKSVEKVIKELKESKFCKREDKAYYLDLETFGIKGRNTKFVFIRKDGTTLYATRDIAYHLWKARNADILVNILGEDHKLESKQVEIALKLIGEEKIPQVIFYSFVSLPGGKMSTRKGRVVYLDDLIDECIKRAYIEVEKRRGKELNEDKMKKISEIVGIGALRYNIIKVQPEKDITFKWEEALNFEGNSSPFIQYAHARACGILSKSKERIDEFDTDLLIENSEIELIKRLAKYPLEIKESSENLKPHNVANYLYNLASSFNQFYRDCPVLSEKNEKLRISRLALVNASKIVLKNGLNVLGIIAPEEM